MGLAIAALALGACEETERAATGGGAEGGGGGAIEPAAEPSLRFFVDDRPHDAASLEVAATEARWGDPVRVVLQAVGPRRRVRVDFSVGSWAVFESSAGGTIDLGLDAPVDGTWTTADVDGPFWSAPPSASPVFDVDVTAADADTGAPLAVGSFRRRPLGDGLERVDVTDGTRVGTLFKPLGASGKLPAVLAFGGSEGGTWAGEAFAAHLADLGYVALGVGYFGAPGLPDELEQVPLEILEQDLAYLASLEDVDESRIAVMGASRGGELALLLGSFFPEHVAAVVAMVPSGYVWGAASGASAAAWTLGGLDVPHVPGSSAQPDVTVVDGETYVAFTPMFLETVAAASDAALAAATIRVGATDGPVLLLAGGDDQLWPSCVLADVAWAELEATSHGASHADERHCFPDAGHLIAFPPGSSTIDSGAYFNADFDAWIVSGGTPMGNARAERAANNALRAFLESALGG